MAQKDEFAEMFSSAVVDLFTDALRVSLRVPEQVGFVLRTIKWQRRAHKTRQAYEAEGLHIPPFMIVSITSRCNLHCKGCYARAQGRMSETEMSTDKLLQVMGEARSLGISIALLAGGEPLVRDDVLPMAKSFPEVIFPVFTNGMLIDEAMINSLRQVRNLVPVISLEGHQGETDYRRGKGVHAHIQELLSSLKKAGVFFGVSTTVTRPHFDAQVNDGLIQELVSAGCKLFFFIEYVPVQEGTDYWVLTDEQRAHLLQAMPAFRDKYPGIFIAFPGDEEAMGGCLGAGRGFVHVSAQGSVEPCPFAPYSDSSLNDMSLKQALSSPLLRILQEHHDELKDTRGGCALWEKREWLKSIMEHTNPRP